MEKKITCISCPLGCPLTVTLEGDTVLGVEGQGCKRGVLYARKECTNPTRIVTSSVPVSGGKWPVVSVKTAGDIPKGAIDSCIRALRQVSLKAPVHIGDVVLHDVSGTGVDIIATKHIEAKAPESGGLN